MAAAATARTNIRAPRDSKAPSTKGRIRPEGPAREVLAAPLSDYTMCPNSVLDDITRRVNPGVEMALCLYLVRQTYGGCFEDYDLKKHTSCEQRDGRWYPQRPRAIDGNQKRIAKELGQSPEAIEKAIQKLKHKDDPSLGVVEVLPDKRSSWLIFRPENIPVMFELRQPAERKPAAADEDPHVTESDAELGPGGQQLVSRTYEPVRLAPGKQQKPIPIDAYVTKVHYENRSTFPIEICSAVEKGVLKYTIGGFAAADGDRNGATIADRFRATGSAKGASSGHAKGRKQGDDRDVDTRKGIGISKNSSLSNQQITDFEQRLTPIFQLAYGKACDAKFAQGIGLAAEGDLAGFVRLVSARFKAIPELESALAGEGELEESGLWLRWAEAVAAGVKRSGLGSGVWIGIARDVIGGGSKNTPAPGENGSVSAKEEVSETPHLIDKKRSDSNFEQFRMAFELGGKPVSTTVGLECKSLFIRYDLETQEQIIRDVVTRFDSIWSEPRYTLAPLKYLRQREWEINPIGERALAAPSRRKSASEDRDAKFREGFRRGHEEGWS